MATQYLPLDTGSTDFGFVDQKGRACGYMWEIRQMVSDKDQRYGAYGVGFDVPAGEPAFELLSNPCRNGKGYGPAFNRAITRTLEEARQIAVKRAEASRKRDTKKFAEFNKETA